MIKRFDKDNDGKLNDEERAAAHKAFEARRGGGQGSRRPRGGGPGAGQGGPDREKMRAEMIKRFDKDGDGKLNDEERATMRNQFEARRGGRGGPGSGGPGRGGNRRRPASDAGNSDASKSDDAKPDENKSSDVPASNAEPGAESPGGNAATEAVEAGVASTANLPRTEIALAIARAGR